MNVRRRCTECGTESTLSDTGPCVACGADDFQLWCHVHRRPLSEPRCPLCEEERRRPKARERPVLPPRQAPPRRGRPMPPRYDAPPPLSPPPSPPPSPERVKRPRPPRMGPTVLDLPPMPGLSPAAAREAAVAKARANLMPPAVLLLLLALLSAAGSVANLGAFVVDPDTASAVTNGPDMEGLACINLSSSLFIAVGAIAMLRLRAWGLAMLAAVMAMVPCLSPMCIGGIPFGLYAAIVLMSPRVRLAFRRD